MNTLLIVRPITADDRMIIAGALLLTGFVLFCVSWPLIWRKIPMNHFYGIRTRDAFLSDNRWYEVNAVGGRFLAYAACAIFATGVVGFFIPANALAPFAIIALIVALGSLLASVVQTLRWTKATRTSVSPQVGGR